MRPQETTFEIEFEKFWYDSASFGVDSYIKIPKAENLVIMSLSWLYLYFRSIQGQAEK
jgi:hypothetical protein